MKKMKFSAIIQFAILLFAIVFSLTSCEDKEFEGLSFEDATFMYDGFEHSIHVGGVPEDANVTYEPSNIQSAAGTYTITATVSAEDYITKTLTANLTIYHPDDYALDDDINALREKLEAAIATMGASNEEKIASLEAAHKALIDALTAEQTANLEKLNALTASYNKKVAELEVADKDNSDALAELETQYATDLAALNKADADNTAAIETLKTNYNNKVAELEAADKDNADALAALESEYEKDLAALNKADTDNKTAIETLTSAYNGKVAELIAADTKNAQDLADLEAQYAIDLEALNKADADNTAAIEALKTNHNNKVAELEAADEANADALTELEAQYAEDLAALNQADADNTAAIETLKTNYNNKVAELEAADKDNADALADLEAQYAIDLEALNKADEDNATALETLKTNYNNKVAELEAADTKNAQDLDTLKTNYEANVIELNAKISANESKTAQCKLDLQTSINNLSSTHDSDIAAINLLIQALQNADTAAELRIIELEAKMAGLLSAFTVTFDVNGENEIIAAQSVKRGEKAIEPADPTREGYTFLGWYVGDEKWSFVGDTVTNDMTLTAKWVSSKILAVADNCALDDNTLTILIKYPSDYVDIKSKITYDENCNVSLYKNSNLTSEYSHCRMTDLTVGQNKAYLLIEYDDNEYTVYDVVVIETVDFMSEGDVFKPISINEDLTVNAPEEIPVSKYPGYEFSHWTVNGESVAFPYTVSIDTVFEAAYTPIVYMITYNVNDGIMPESYTTEYTVESGAVLPVPTRSLYLFDGWYESAAFDGETIDSISVGEYGNKTYYAKWESATNGVTYSLSDDESYYTVTGYEGTSTEIVIPDTVDGVAVTTIADSAFQDKQRITSITVPNSVTYIGDLAFYDCDNLTSVTIGNNVTIVGYNAFASCQSLEEIYFNAMDPKEFGYDTFGSDDRRPIRLIIGKNVKYLPPCLLFEAMYPAPTFVEIIVDSDNSYLKSVDDVLYTTDGKTLLLYPKAKESNSFVIPYGVTSIGNEAFASCYGLTSITIPTSVTSISDYAFSGCRSLTSIIIPDSVATIGAFAFYECTRLTNVTIGNSVTSIVDHTFSGCDILTNIAVDENNTAYKSIDGNLYSKDGKTLIQYAIGKSESVFIVPNGVAYIGDYAFSGCNSLTNVVIPDSVTTIGNWAFYGCSSLTSIAIPDSVTDIESNAFYSCDNLTIYCEASSKPIGWSTYWKSSNCHVVWGCKE